MTKIPPLDIFTHYESEQYELGTELTEEKVKAILNKNCFKSEDEEESSLTIYAFISMINHGEANIFHLAQFPFLHMWYSQRDI